jgi:SpoVK/Ycf46/Vps4 family AAA+-type ATPase|tara:strand:- start:1607 stop:2038 length:432 start_codon:yes stop_codon:yes gene_type:complete
VDVLDKALVRAGRFDRKITVQAPTREGRLQILKVHVRDKPLNSDVDLIDLAAEMNGFTGAIIANVVNTACLSAAREGRYGRARVSQLQIPPPRFISNAGDCCPYIATYKTLTTSFYSSQTGTTSTRRTSTPRWRRRRWGKLYP